MPRRTCSTIIFLAVAGCTSQDAQPRPVQTTSLEELARQAELVRQAGVQSDIHQREQSRDLVFTRLTGHEQRIQTLRNDSLGVSNQLTTLNGEVGTYLMNHKIAVVCMGLVGMAVSDDNEYAEEVEGIVNGGAILCGLGLLSAGFRSEIAGVFDRLMQADAQAKSLQSQILALNDQIAQETVGSAGARVSIDSINSEIQALRLQLPQAPPPPN